MEKQENVLKHSNWCYTLIRNVIHLRQCFGVFCVEMCLLICQDNWRHHLIKSTVKHYYSVSETEKVEKMSDNNKLLHPWCMWMCDTGCVLHTYNIKRHLAGPEAVLALLPSLLLLLWWISSSTSHPSHPSLLLLLWAYFMQKINISNIHYTQYILTL